MDEANGGSGLESSSTTNCPTFAQTFPTGASLGLCTTQLPALPGQRKSPNCLSRTPAAGWRCGSSYPGGRRQGGGGTAAEQGPGAGVRCSPPCRPSLVGLFLLLRAFLTSGPFPAFIRTQALGCKLPSASDGLGFPTALSGQRQAELGHGRGAGGWAGAPASRPLKAGASRNPCHAMQL